MPCRCSIAFSSCEYLCVQLLPFRRGEKLGERLMGFHRLLFMTYNGWVMLAVAVGAFVGYLMFSADMSSEKTVACH